MAQSDTFRCQVVTPEAAVLDVQAEFVAFTAHDGEIGILRNRAPLLCKLGVGEMRIRAAGGDQRYYIEGGFAQVIDNEVTLLTQKALAPEAIDAAAAKQSLADLQSQSPVGLDQVEARSIAIKRVTTQLKVASGRSN